MDGTAAAITSAPRSRAGVGAGAAVCGIALVARLAILLVSSGGPLGLVGYDQAVYFTAADALLAGRAPYRDFTLLHPPGMMLLLTPFAALGHLIGDRPAFVAANLFGLLLGTASAGLVYLVARRLGLSIAAAFTGGCAYAVWYVAIIAEYSARLEAVTSFAFLCGVAALLVPPSRARRWPVLAGVAFGFAITVKVWEVLPVLVLLGWQWATGREGRRIALAAAGLAGTVVAVCLPFFVTAPSLMWHRIVLDQLGRLMHYDQLHRLDQLTTLSDRERRLLLLPHTVLLVLCGLVALVLAASAWRVERARGVVVVAAAQFALLMVTPQYYAYYGAFVAPALALSLAAAAQRGPAGLRWPRLGPVVAAVVVACLAITPVANVVHGGANRIPAFPRDRLAAAVRPVHCVISDSPMALIELDVLTRDLARGCPNWVDVIGRTYGVDGVSADRVVARRRNPKWQADLRRYLLSGDAMISIYRYIGFNRQTKSVIARLPILGAADGYTIYRTGPAARRLVPN